MISSYSYLFRFIIIGDASVGKSCTLMQLLEGKFKVDSETTVGVQFGSKILVIDDHRIKLQIWDTAGQEAFKSITRSYYRGSIGAILMYDITSRTSFNNLSKWVDETKNYANENLTIMLVGNKKDIKQKREISTIEARSFADDHQMLFVECSAKNHDQTEDIFSTLTKEILKKIDDNKIDPKNQNLGVKMGTYQGMRLSSQDSRKWNCCWQ